MEKLGHLERIRKEKGLSRNELAKLSGVNETTIQHLEQGICNVNMVKLGTLIALAKALNCKVADLLDKNLKSIVG